EPSFLNESLGDTHPARITHAYKTGFHIVAASIVGTKYLHWNVGSIATEQPNDRISGGRWRSF
ncbi:MAG TPA: hypothetical protein VED01_14205, partial [Burkholderiales bacterium]|nr:hypothetical protein [Burkholderiales bacterium]